MLICRRKNTYLQIVVLQNFNQGISQIRDLHPFLNTVNQQNWVYMCADVVQQASNKCCKIPHGTMSTSAMYIRQSKGTQVKNYFLEFPNSQKLTFFLFHDIKGKLCQWKEPESTMMTQDTAFDGKGVQLTFIENLHYSSAVTHFSPVFCKVWMYLSPFYRQGNMLVK